MGDFYLDHFFIFLIKGDLVLCIFNFQLIKVDLRHCLAGFLLRFEAVIRSAQVFLKQIVSLFDSSALLSDFVRLKFELELSNLKILFFKTILLEADELVPVALTFVIFSRLFQRYKLAILRLGNNP